MDNQFINTPMLVNSNQQKIAEVNRRDQLIKTLQLKNNKLKTQIHKIKSIIQEKFSQQQNSSPPPKRQSIMKIQENNQTLHKQLANVYKKIKMYQYQISKIQQFQGSITVSQKAVQMDNIIKEKKALTDKLKVQLQKQQKIINQNIKKLANNNKQQQIQNQVKSLTDQIKYLKQKLKDLQQKGQIKQKNLKKQYQFVQQRQNQLLENGFTHTDLEEIKQKVIKKNTHNTTQNDDGAGFSKLMNKTHLNRQRQRQKKQKEEQKIQDRTIDRYRSLQNQVRILQKMQGDYQKQINVLQEEKKIAMEKNFNSKNKVIQCQNDIEKLEKQIAELKGKVIPSNMKPLMPLRSLSSHTPVNSSSNKTKLKITTHHNTSLTMRKNPKQLPHILKYDEVGIASQKGTKFTDRNLLGKNNLYTFIIGIIVFFDKDSELIAGLQFIYNQNKRGGQYVRKDKQSRQKQFNEQRFICQQGDYVKSISGTLDSTDKLQSFSVVTKKNKTQNFGRAKTFKKSFNFEIGSQQVPVCLFGSLIVIKQNGKKETSMIQHFGVEINKEISGKKDKLVPTLEDPQFQE